MKSNIRRQIDPEDKFAGYFVCFIEATERWRRGNGRFGEICTGETYAAVIYRRPVTQARPFVASCGHEHRSIDAADQCGRRWMRRELPTVRVHHV